ncbi:hypothetical protein [Jatrophihabitans fulvus]
MQTTLWERRDELAAAGIRYPLEHPGEHVDVAMDVRRAPLGGRWDPAWDDAWGRVAARITAGPQSRAVLSTELLGGAARPQITGMVAAVAPADVHVVFTARDVARALASDWQQQLTRAHTVTFDRFVDDLVRLGRDAPAPFGEMFWGLHDPVEVLAPWADVLGADHVHVVTVPHADDRDELWRRFASVVGIDASIAHESGEADTPLGVVEAELLRRLNEQGPLEKRLTWMYDGLARLELAEWILARRTSARPLTLPQRHHAWAREHGERTVAAIGKAGYDVVGSPDDLRPQLTSGDQPAELSDAELLDASVETVAALLLRLGVVQNPPS